MLDYSWQFFWFRVDCFSLFSTIKLTENWNFFSFLQVLFGWTRQNFSPNLLRAALEKLQAGVQLRLPVVLFQAGSCKIAHLALAACCRRHRGSAWRVWPGATVFASWLHAAHFCAKPELSPHGQLLWGQRNGESSDRNILSRHQQVFMRDVRRFTSSYHCPGSGCETALSTTSAPATVVWES